MVVQSCYGIGMTTID